MYRDLNDYRIRRDPPPRKPSVSLTERQQTILICAVMFELFFLFVAPICGSSVIDAFLAVIRAI